MWILVALATGCRLPRAPVESEGALECRGHYEESVAVGGIPLLFADGDGNTYLAEVALGSGISWWEFDSEAGEVGGALGQKRYGAVDLSNRAAQGYWYTASVISGWDELALVNEEALIMTQGDDEAALEVAYRMGGTADVRVENAWNVGGELFCVWSGTSNGELMYGFGRLSLDGSIEALGDRLYWDELGGVPGHRIRGYWAESRGEFWVEGIDAKYGWYLDPWSGSAVQADLPTFALDPVAVELSSGGIGGVGSGRWSHYGADGSVRESALRPDGNGRTGTNIDVGLVAWLDGATVVTHAGGVLQVYTIQGPDYALPEPVEVPWSQEYCALNDDEINALPPGAVDPFQ